MTATQGREGQTALSRGAFDEVPHGVDAIGLEDVYARGAVSARGSD
jgi:hypothetical protein